MSKKTLAFDSAFDTYTASAILGEGGAGRVYVVKNMSGDEYALKCLAADRITSTRLKRFKNEIQFCQQSCHPNIVKVVDTGAIVLEGVKCPFYVMRRYSGTLRTQMGKMKSNEIMCLFSQILDGVEAAHLSKVWHRDIKPENILYDHNERRALVADFGIAHFEEEELYTAVETKSTDRLANFQYSAPEQRTRNSNADNRSDIFALGLILNEMFTGEILQGAGHKKIIEIDSSYGYLDDIIEWMTQQNPANRPESIEKIKMELIGRKNAYIALQKFEEAKRQVVLASEPPEFEPIKIINFDYESGVLKLKFNRSAPPDWIQEYQYPRHGHSAIMGYGPERHSIRGDTATISVGDNEHLIQDIINHAKEYTRAANEAYVRQMREQAKKEEQQRRIALEKQIADAEKRKKILSTVKV